MVISSGAVQDFLNRKLKDSGFAKQFPEQVLDEKIAAIQPTPEFALPPYKHQKACFLLGHHYGSYMLMLEMGVGKTKISLDLFSQFKREGSAKRMLVLVPNGSNVVEWGLQVELHAPGLTYAQLLSGDDKKTRQDKALGTEDVLISTYAGWNALVCSRSKGKMRIDPALAKQYEKSLDMAVFDESIVLKNHQSLTFQVCKRLMTLPHRFCLSGAPFDYNPEDLWTQFYLVDGGETLGPTLGLFRAAFFSSKKNYWSGYPEYTFKKSMTDDLNRVLRNRSIVYTEEECQDLPDRVYSTRHSIFPTSSWKHYRDLVDELESSHGNYQMVENAFLRMRYLCSGFMELKDEEGESQIIEFEENPKLDSLIDLLSEIPETRKVLVFNQYKKTGDIICDRLKKEKIKHVRLYSGTKKKEEVQKSFLEDPKIRVLVGSESVAYGLNLQVANYVIFFESPLRPTIRAQMEKRAHRAGQTRRVFIYDLVMKAGVDERILEALKEGKDLMDSIVKEGASALK